LEFEKLKSNSTASKLQLHSKMQRLLIFLLVINVSILGSQAECNGCASNTNVACISDTEFQFCLDNRPYGPINSCPTDNYCTNQLTICQKNASLNACRDCGKCNDQKTFACTGPRTFALCLGSDIPSNVTGRCSPEYVCNVHVTGICGNESETSATCPWNTDTTTPEPTTESSSDSTTPKSTTASINDYCRNASHGISLHAIPNDTDCTR